VVRNYLIKKLTDDRDMAMIANIDDLFNQIIQEPLDSSEGILPVIVIDALDECGGLDGRHSQHRKDVLRTLQAWSTLPGRFKIVVTSRGEDDIERTLKDMSQVINISAGSNVSSQSQRDIEAFIFHQFREIAAWSSLESDWPGSQVVQRLADMSGGLFIWARVVVEFISSGEPVGRLRLVEAGTGSAGDMATLYSGILKVSFPAPITPEVMNAFHSTLGAIILAREPLSAASLERLVPIEAHRLQYICRELKSVVNSEDVLRITHQSFVDFLINSKACPPAFCINLEKEERSLALACLRTMKYGLRFNICNLESSYIIVYPEQRSHRHGLTN
jgi:hypothetical protein